MDRVVAARKLIGELVKDGQLEVRRAEVVAKDLAALVQELGRAPSGRELEDWLGEHAQVTELFASESVLDELVERHLAPPRAAIEVPDAHHPELEQRMRESPDDGTAFQVYADWLQEQGDPLGELIALGIANETERWERHRSHHEARFFAGLSKEHLRRVQLEWRFGMVRAIAETVEHGMLGPYEWTQLARARACLQVRRIELLQIVHVELDAAIAEHAAPSLRELSLYASGDYLPEKLLARELHVLAIHGRAVTLAPHRLPKTLVSLELRVPELALTEPLVLGIRELRVTQPTARHLGSAKLPELERLVVLGVDGELVHALPALPAAAHLELRDGRVTAETFSVLAKTALVRSVRSLALVDVELDDALADALAQHEDAFPALETLDVSFNELTATGLAALRELAPHVRSTRQHRTGSSAERRIRKFAGSRLQAAESIADPALWRDAGIDGDVRWARYQGDDRYELFVTADLARYGCTCPSSIQPCKHVVALAFVATRTGLRRASSNGIEARVQRFEPIRE